MSDSTNLQWAKYYTSRGWNIVPVTVYSQSHYNKATKQNESKKKPDFPFGWKDNTPTTDLEKISSWYSADGEAERPAQGIAIVTGPESDLAIIDVDNEYAWDMLLTELDITAPITYTVKSQSGKSQLYFKWPKAFGAGHYGKKLTAKCIDQYDENGSQTPRGVDLLEAGNVVFAPPTNVISYSGEITGSYTLANDAPIAEMPDEIVEYYLNLNKRKASVSSSTGERVAYTKADWPTEWDQKKADYQMRNILNWCQEQFEELEADPYSLWDNGVARIMGVLVRVVNAPWFTFSEADLDVFLGQYAPEDGGFTNSDHMRIKNSIFRSADGDAVPYSAEEYDADALMTLWMANQTREDAKVKEIVTKNGLLANIPEEFWNARPLFQAFRQNAWYRSAPADATLHAFLASYTARIPHQYEVDTGIGSPANLVYFAALVGSSGGGKGRSTSVGIELSRNELKKYPLGTGEGIAEFFLDTVIDYDDERNYKKDKDGKLTTDLINNPSTKKEQVRHNLLMVETEGKSLSQLNERNGTTLSTVLLKLGMGEDLGNLNATASANRHVDGGTYCCGLIGGFQVQVSGELLSQTETGLAQRFLWSSTTDPAMVQVDPPMPLAFHEPLEVPWTMATSKVNIGVAQSIKDQLRSEDILVITGQKARDPFDSHKPVRMIQLATVLRMLDGPNIYVTSEETGAQIPRGYTITEEDWHLANLIFDASSEVRRQLVEAVAEKNEEDLVKQGAVDARRNVARQEAEVEVKNKNIRDRAILMVERITDSGKSATKAAILRLGWSEKSTKEKVETFVLPMLVEEGLLLLDGENYTLPAVTS